MVMLFRMVIIKRERRRAIISNNVDDDSDSVHDDACEINSERFYLARHTCRNKRQ